MSDTSRELLADYCVGSEEAAKEIFHRYLLRLTALARMRLSERIARRVDPEDVVLSAYRSFFVAARNGRFELESPGDLWRLLVSITLHKLYRQIAALKTLKRSMGNESPLEGFDLVASRDPTPEEVLTASEELEAILKALPPQARRVVELRLQGETLKSIAKEICRNERTVRRMLEDARQVFQSRLNLANNGDPSVLKNVEASPNVAHQQSESEPVVERPVRKKQPKNSPQFAIDFPVHLKRLVYSDYLLEQFVGSGGSGKVYRARERQSGRELAVKFLRKSFQSIPEAVQRFIKEASIVTQLHHEGIVHLHGLGITTQGSYFMVSDWLPDGDVNRRMQSGRIPVAQAVRWVCQGALAIQYLHEHGLVHCDLKPSNLLINPRGNVVVTDFGLARSLSFQENWSIEGTAGFMALEQAVPGAYEIGPRTDVFGLGAVLYALLTGHPPIKGNRPSEILAKLIANHPIKLPSQIRTEIPTELDELCLECLNRDPGKRPGSAQELAERLQRLETPCASQRG